MRRPLPHARQEGQASSVTRPLEGRQETKKARSVVASSRVHSWRTSVSRSPPTAGLGVGPSTPAAVRPLVRMPTDRHAATGTCELGERTLTQSGPKIQDANLPAPEILPAFLHEIRADASPGKFAAKPCRRKAVSRAGLLIRKCPVANLIARASRK